MVELESLDSSPLRESSPSQFHPKSSTPADNRDNKMKTPVNQPPPMRPSLSTLPRPLFSDEPARFSTKKERGTCPNFKPPPRPPAKSCPPRSRLFKKNELYKAQAVSFLDSSDGKKVTGTPLNPKLYDKKLGASYFHQAFKVESEIGRGYFGTVFRVRSKEDGQLYAVKIANECYKGYSDRERKLEEVRKHQFLPTHSNLVKFISSWEEEGNLYQQFELCTGNLQDYCEKNNNVKESLVWRYLVDLLQAVQHLHNHDLVHMDIKPDNIFFGFDGRCKLGDFGLIVDLATHPKEGLREGDSKYLAPEVLEGLVSKSCDIFSLGITILEVACDLDLPNKGLLWNDLRDRGPDPRLTLHLSPELRRVIQLMMTNDPERRPGVNQILELPSVAKAVRWREWEIMYFGLVCQFLGLFRPLALLLQYCLHLLETMFGLLKIDTPAHTPPVEATSRRWMDAYTDDEDLDCTVSSRGSDLALPLKDSTSGSSEQHSVSKLSPTVDIVNPAIRRPMTSPGLRSRRRCTSRTPLVLSRTGLRSPQKLLFLQGLDESPTRRPFEVHPKEEQQLFPCIQPQSLANTFDCLSDDE